jgi:hypothetical protein
MDYSMSGPIRTSNATEGAVPFPQAPFAKSPKRAHNEAEMIQIKHLSGNEWSVAVEDTTTTHHRVRVTQMDLERFSEGRTAEALLTESFRFLLEREPNTSILSSFDLSIITRYFPEYEQEIRQRLRCK